MDRVAPTLDENWNISDRSGPAAKVVRTALRIREAGDLDDAVALLRCADLENPAVALIYFRLLHDLQAYAELQTALANAIQTPEFPVDAELEYFDTLVRFAQRYGLNSGLLEALNRRLVPLMGGRPDAEKLAFAALRHRLKFRSEVLSQYSALPHLISLGLNCLAWHVPTMWGMRTARDVLDDTSPFALAGHSIKGLIQALDGGFGDYCDPSQVRVVETQRGHKMPLRKDRGAFWNHNRNEFWVKQNMEQLRVNLSGKIAVFREACLQKNAVFLLGKCEILYPQEPLDFLPALNDALASYTDTRENRIIICNFTSSESPRLIEVDEFTKFMYCSYPREDYVWHDELTEDSREGLTFERRFMRLLIAGLERLNVLRRQSAIA